MSDRVKQFIFVIARSFSDEAIRGFQYVLDCLVPRHATLAAKGFFAMTFTNFWHSLTCRYAWYTIVQPGSGGASLYVSIYYYAFLHKPELGLRSF